MALNSEEFFHGFSLLIVKYGIKNNELVTGYNEITVETIDPVSLNDIDELIKLNWYQFYIGIDGNFDRTKYKSSALWYYDKQLN